MERSEAWMTLQRPHLVRAYHAWIMENELTPYIWVDATYMGVQVPRDYVEDGQITLNISPEVLLSLDLHTNDIRCQALFQGTAYRLVIPMMAILGIYAKENRAGATFMSPEKRVLRPSLLSPLSQSTGIDRGGADNASDRPAPSALPGPLRIVRE